MSMSARKKWVGRIRIDSPLLEYGCQLVQSISENNPYEYQGQNLDQRDEARCTSNVRIGREACVGDCDSRGRVGYGWQKRGSDED